MNSKSVQPTELIFQGESIGYQSGSALVTDTIPSITGRGAGVWYRTSLFLLFLVSALLVFAILPATSWVRSETTLILAQTGITIIFLISSLLLRRSVRGREFVELFYAFFVASLALLMSLLFSNDLLFLFGSRLTSISGIALAKLSQAVLRILPILLIIGFSRDGRRSLYLNRGRLAVGTAVGLSAFAIFAILAILPLWESSATLTSLLPTAPWIILFIFSNAFEEELLFRGLFLKRYESFLGKGLATFLTAIVFTLLHMQVTYASDLVQFLVILFPLALAWGFLIQKTDSLWGAIIFHAGADLLIIVGVFAVL